jgi:hypothetical protein
MVTKRDCKEDTKHCYQGRRSEKGGEGKNIEAVLPSYVFFFFFFCSWHVIIIFKALENVRISVTPPKLALANLEGLLAITPVKPTCD